MSTRHKNCKEDQRSFALRGIHTPRTHSLQGLQFSNFVFELLNLKATWVQKTQHMLEHWMDLLHPKIIQSNLLKHSFYPT